LDPNENYDVVVAGAGTAGCVLASRLSEDPDVRVLLVEAGPDPASPGAEDPNIVDPFALAACFDSAYHWPGQRAAYWREDGPAGLFRPYIQAWGVGGASNINAMGVDRGIPDDFDEWRDLGATGWSWAEVLPFFKTLEHDQEFGARSSLHGDDGPMPVGRAPRASWSPFAAAIAGALERRTFSFLEDYTGEFGEGFSSVPTNSVGGRRVSTAMAYLTREVRDRSNLTILTGARLDRLSFAGRHADGAFLRVGGGARLVRAREVVLCCGALQTPAVMMRSGIGKPHQLDANGIKVVRSSPGVGANLQNHPSVSLTTYLPPSSSQPRGDQSFVQNWLRFSSHHPGCSACDMHLMAFNRGSWHALGARIGAVTVAVLKPHSRGAVELAGPDPNLPPKVEFNMLSDPRDMERLVAGLRFAAELLLDPGVAEHRRQVFVPDARLVASLTKRSAWNAVKAAAIVSILDIAPLRALLLNSSQLDLPRLLADEATLREHIRQNAGVQFHPSGTCRMGRADDPSAVVDNSGRVHGVAGLRISDASIFPTIPRGYPHFIVIMAAEKIADALKADLRRAA
jgi:5-(hydroxymethyl)furfural/furfural oxidase